MTNTATETKTVVVERDIAHPPEKLWRALTQPHLIEEWLMKNDFSPVVGHRFNLRGEWGGVLDCEVLAIEPQKTLSYTWNFSHDDAAFDLTQRGDLHADADAFGNPPAHGANGLPTGPEAGVRRRPAGLGAVFCKPGAGSRPNGLRPPQLRAD